MIQQQEQGHSREANKSTQEITSSRAPKTIGKVNNRRNASNMQGYSYKQQQKQASASEQASPEIQATADTSASEQASTGIQATADTLVSIRTRNNMDTSNSRHVSIRTSITGIQATADTSASEKASSGIRSHDHVSLSGCIILAAWHITGRLACLADSLARCHFSTSKCRTNAVLEGAL
jgi:hypothetical protein